LFCFLFVFMLYLFFVLSCLFVMFCFLECKAVAAETERKRVSEKVRNEQLSFVRPFVISFAFHKSLPHLLFWHLPGRGRSGEHHCPAAAAADAANSLTHCLFLHILYQAAAEVEKITAAAAAAAAAAAQAVIDADDDAAAAALKAAQVEARAKSNRNRDFNLGADGR
jgi:hypothetical protein